MKEFLVTADVLFNDISWEEDPRAAMAKTDALLAMQEEALRPYVLSADHTGLEPTLLRHWVSYGTPGTNYGDVALWLAEDEQQVRDIYARFPLVMDSRMTIAGITALHPAGGDSFPGLRDRNRHHGSGVQAGGGNVQANTWLG